MCAWIRMHTYMYMYIHVCIRARAHTHTHTQSQSQSQSHGLSRLLMGGSHTGGCWAEHGADPAAAAQRVCSVVQCYREHFERADSCSPGELRHTNAQTHARTHTHTNTHTHTQTHTNKRKHTYVPQRTHPSIHPSIHTYIHTYMHTYMDVEVIAVHVCFMPETVQDNTICAPP